MKIIAILFLARLVDAKDPITFLRGIKKENTKIFLGSKYGPQGFGWTVPIKEKKLLIGVLTKGKSKEITKSFIKSLLNKYQFFDSNTVEIRTWGIPIKPIEKTYEERTLIIGDAAGLVKPITGGGIYYSQLSGKIAAEIMDKALSKNSFFVISSFGCGQ